MKMKTREWKKGGIKGKLKMDWKQEGTRLRRKHVLWALLIAISVCHPVGVRQALGKMLKYLRQITEQMEVKTLSYCARSVGVLHGGGS